MQRSKRDLFGVNTEHKIEHDSTTDYIDEHIYDVTCLAEGTTEVAFNIGNSKTGSEQ